MVGVADDLAACLRALGEDEAARRLSEDTVARIRRVFGGDHPRTLRAADTRAATPPASAGCGLAGRYVSGQAGDSEPH